MFFTFTTCPKFGEVTGALNSIYRNKLVKPGTDPFFLVERKTGADKIYLNADVFVTVAPLDEIDLVYISKFDKICLVSACYSLRYLFERSKSSKGSLTLLDNLILWKEMTRTVLPAEVVLYIYEDIDIGELFSMLDKEQKIPLISKLVDNDISIIVGRVLFSAQEMKAYAELVNIDISSLVREELLPAQEMKAYAEILKRRYKSGKYPVNLNSKLRTLSDLRKAFQIFE